MTEMQKQLGRIQTTGGMERCGKADVSLARDAVFVRSRVEQIAEHASVDFECVPVMRSLVEASGGVKV